MNSSSLITENLIRFHTPKILTFSSFHTFDFTNPIKFQKTRNHNNALTVNAIGRDGGGGGGLDLDTAAPVVVEKEKPKVSPPRFEVFSGSPTPFGATVLNDGVNFAIFSRNATSATLCLMSPSDLPQKRVTEDILLDQLTNKTGDVWHVFLKGDFTDMLYGYKFSGEFSPEEGHYYDSSQILLDPYAKAVVSRGEFGVMGPDDDCWSQMAGKIPSIDEFDWEGDLPLALSQRDLVIYEMHVRGFTRHESSNIESRGTYLGVVDKLDHLKRLEFLGDSVLHLLITWYLYKKKHKDIYPGELKDLSSGSVHNENFAYATVRRNLHQYQSGYLQSQIADYVKFVTAFSTDTNSLQTNKIPKVNFA